SAHHSSLPSERHHTPWFVWLIGGCLGALAVVVLTVALLAGLIGGLFLKLSQEPTLSAQSTSIYTVNGAPTLNAQNVAGNITFQTGADGQVIIQATKQAHDTSGSSAQQDLQQIQVDIAQQGNSITVQTHFDTSGAGVLGVQRSVALTITVPAQATISANTGAGNIKVSGVSGVMQLNDGAGTLTLDQVTLGNGSQLEDAAGTINFNGALASGASASMHANAGDINVTLPITTATTISARANAGHITVHGWSLAISRAAYGSSSRVIGQTAPIARGTLSLQTDAGNITLTASS
ncbi:MAG TPA: DUF4097 family beta strand repeat-containing protein, partial [Ktedonobacterales bacterium]|nr:DUF4097 family beta strand repeat-containing protein [Ktedonobacterales bacterium]